nr:InuG [synthetic construct]
MNSQINRGRLIAHWTFDEGKGKEVTEVINGIKAKVNYVFNNAKFKPSSDPLWRQNGVDNGALLFDGYSTYIEYKQFNHPTEAITVSVWVAPRAFEWGDKGQLSSFINQHDKSDKSGFCLGMYRHGTFSFQVGLGETWLEVWNEKDDLQKFKWAHVVGTYDSKTSTIKLFKNGIKVGEKKLPDDLKRLKIKKSTESLMIGRHNQAAAISVFNANMFNGLMDDIKIYNYALSEEEIKNEFEKYVSRYGGKIPEISWDDIKLDPRILADDIYRPQYHAIAPQHWMNEPHAPFYYNGKYHLFYQHNPFGPFWHQIHWGHWVSDDMVHWEFVKEALSPEKDNLAPDGIWSGSATYDENNHPVLFFTAGNDSKIPNQSIGMAKPKDLNDPYLIEWEKYPMPVVEQKPGQGKLGQFRDPFVWKDEKENKWYMLIGSGIPKKGGTALFYVSTDLINWEYKGPFFTIDYDKYSYTGEHWELPVLLPVKNEQGMEKHIFLISPHGAGADVEVFYWLGKFDKENYRFVPEHEEPRLIDLGDSIFTGPSGFVDLKTGRTILFTIAQGDRTPWDEYYAGWAHNAGLPLELSLDKQGDLRISPIRELQSLREKQLVSIENKKVSEVNEDLKYIKGDMLEIQVEIQNINSHRYGIIVRQSQDKREKTSIYYDEEKKGLYINRLNSSLNSTGKGIKGGKLDLEEDTLRLHIYLDRSMVEIYANNKKSITSRVYPTLPDALGIEAFADGEITIKSMKVWKMGSAYKYN